MTMELVETIEVGSGGAYSIEFTSIPDTGVDLVILASGRITGNAGAADLRFNSDSGSNYAQQRLTGTGFSVTAGRLVGDRVNIEFSGSNQTSSTYGNLEIRVSNYTSSIDKSISVDAVTENNASGAKQEITSATYATSSPISSVQIIKGFAQYSSFSLYIIY